MSEPLTSEAEGLFTVLRQSVDPETVAAIERFVGEASDRALCRINLIDFAARQRLDEERVIADEFLAHARALRRERMYAIAEEREPRTLELLQAWGGVTIAYRRRLIDSPSYTLNHEEVQKALEEGIRFAEGLTPLAFARQHNHREAAALLQRHSS